MLQKSLFYPFSCLTALAVSGNALAVEDAELAAIKTQISQMKAAYEDRIAALEARLAKAEAKTAVTPAVAAPPATNMPARSGPAAFNPEISLILDGKYTNTSRDPETYRIRGFIPNGGEIAPPKRSFSIGETELALSANVDHLFRGEVRVSMAGDESKVSTEEAYLETLALPAGFKLKAGRHLSGIGYLNQQHPHSWDFVDAPLAYKAFYGSRLANDGVQVKWVAPTDLFLELGGEVARGGSFPSSEGNSNGSGLSTVFAHVGGDIGASHAWQAGLSYVSAKAQNREWGGVDALNAETTNQFTGTSRTWGADFVWKWAPEGNATRTNFKFQAEYFQRKERGDLGYDDSKGSNAVGSVNGGYRSNQSGWYAQGVWQFMPQWRLGLRHDALSSGSLRVGLVDNGTISAADLPALAAYAPRRNTAMIDWSPSEFSRVRLQFARDNARGPGLTDNQFFLQYILSLGAHGAHRF